MAVRFRNYLYQLCGFIARAPQWGLEWSLDTLVNESLIPRGRNALVARAMNNHRATHLMFLDADIGFEPEYILMLLQENVDVIGGGYPKKSLPIDYVINPLADGVADEAKAEVERIGTGFLLLKREVFSRMAEAMPELKYTDDCGLDPQSITTFMLSLSVDCLGKSIHE